MISHRRVAINIHTSSNYSKQGFISSTDTDVDSCERKYISLQNPFLHLNGTLYLKRTAIKYHFDRQQCKPSNSSGGVRVTTVEEALLPRSDVSWSSGNLNSPFLLHLDTNFSLKICSKVLKYLHELYAFEDEDIL